jgi:hypothetical protein
MIHGNKRLKISEYLPIDRCGEGYGYIKPKDGETFIGMPYGFYADNSEPFIEITRNGKLIATVNALDVSEIHFREESDAAE